LPLTRKFKGLGISLRRLHEENTTAKVGTGFAAIDMNPLNLSGQRQKIDEPCHSNPAQLPRSPDEFVEPSLGRARAGFASQKPPP
jgi:hypothetical protein